MPISTPSMERAKPEICLLYTSHLQKDGTVTIPKVLQLYMGGKEVLVPKK